MYTYDWATLLYSINWHNVNQLYFNKKMKTIIFFITTKYTDMFLVREMNLNSITIKWIPKNILVSVLLT